MIRVSAAALLSRGLAGYPLKPRLRKACAALAVLLVVAVVCILLLPTPPAAAIQDFFKDVLGGRHRYGDPARFGGYKLFERLANIIMFVPLGFLLAAVLPPRGRLLVVPLAAVLSGVSELTQAYLLPGRVGSWYDLLANTTGAAVGALLLIWLSSLKRLRATPH